MFYQSEEYISHSNTKKGVVSALYQSVRKHTLRKKLGLVESRVGRKGKALDIGCGTGEFLNTLKTAGWETLGVEPGDQAREAGKKNYGLDVREESALSTLSDKSFDLITMWHVLEHVPGLNDRVVEIGRLLKDEGVLVVAVPNRNSHDAKYYGAYWAAYDVPRHLWHFRPEDIKALFLKHGFAVKEVLPMPFDSYYVSMLSEKYKTGSTNLVSAVWRGLVSNMKAGGDKWSSQIYIIRKAK
ncbi:MAG: class I SAM-dependent methyltransferase [Bacteroidia bacterium]